jgi:TrmH family RNA methyltransferase
MRVRVVLVSPEYQQNIGYCCRVMKNFGFTELFLVRPACEISQEAIKYSKHAVDVLENAKIVQSLGAATKGCGKVVGTTAIRKISKELTRESITPKELAGNLSGSKGKIALLIGREGTGLSREELRDCDAVVRIEANPEYGTLNISHALAILLYELSKDKSKPTVEAMGENERNLLLRYFNSLVDSNKQGMRNPGTIKLSFKRILGRGVKSKFEAMAMLKILKNLTLNLGKK